MEAKNTPNEPIDNNTMIAITRYCEQQSIKLTPLRESLLRIMAARHRPITAYELLDELKQSKPKAQPMSVYRVLDFFQNHHLVHRIESLNAFMLCDHLAEKHLSQWLICHACGDVQECALPIFTDGIDDIQAKTGFTVEQSIFELSGLCQSCQQDDSDTPTSAP